jgi:hypothetical protein
VGTAVEGAPSEWGDRGEGCTGSGPCFCAVQAEGRLRGSGNGIVLFSGTHHRVGWPAGPVGRESRAGGRRLLLHWTTAPCGGMAAATTDLPAKAEGNGCVEHQEQYGNGFFHTLKLLGWFVFLADVGHPIA